MYSGEASGQKFPPMMGYPAWDAPLGAQDPAPNCNKHYDYPSIGPRGQSIYPEYLTDINVLNCPSSARQKKVQVIDDAIIAQEGGCLPFKNQIAQSDMSYAYWGYLIDLADPGQLAADEVRELPIESKVLMAPCQLISVYFFVNMAQEKWDPDPNKLDEDATGLFYPNSGNTRGDTVYRLREGIERFMITDINNAAASAKAQSSIVIMSDLLSNTGSDALFNHIPGGSNVLFMDGHVEFQKYNAEGPMPCNKLIANVIGLLSQ
jgi:prepilin-type processing-associated H-X9-DG protein